MSTQTADYLDAATHLPDGARLVLHNVAWDDYERLLVELGDRLQLRVSYDSGRMDIMSPSARHESIKNLLHDLVVIACEEQARASLSFGSVTLKRERFSKGVEADDCFYFRDLESAIGKDRFDLSADPPPDLAIEVDLTHESSRKLAIYAALGVPDVWQFTADEVLFWHLDENGAYHGGGQQPFVSLPYLRKDRRVPRRR